MAEPYAHSKIKFDIQNLAATWSSEHLNSIMSKIDIKIDETELKQRNLTKEQVLAQLYSDIALGERTYEFTKPGESPMHPEDLRKEFVLKSKIAFLTRAAIFKHLEKEALDTFIKIQRARELHAALREYIRKIAEDNYQKFLFIAQAERMKVEELMNEKIMEELARINKEAWEHWNLLQIEIDKLDEEIQDLKLQKNIIIEKHLDALISASKNFTFKGKRLDQILDSNQLKNFNFNLIQNIHLEETNIENAKRKITKAKQKRKHNENALQKVIAEINLSLRTQDPNKKTSDRTYLIAMPLNVKSGKTIENHPTVIALKNEIVNNKADENAAEKQEIEANKRLENVFKNALANVIGTEKAKEFTNDDPSVLHQFKEHVGTPMTVVFSALKKQNEVINKKEEFKEEKMENQNHLAKANEEIIIRHEKIYNIHVKNKDDLLALRQKKCKNL